MSRRKMENKVNEAELVDLPHRITMIHQKRMYLLILAFDAATRFCIEKLPC